jgi:hypothetical protein
MMVLPQAEDAAEDAMDRRNIRLQVDVSPWLHRRLKAEQLRRREERLPYSLRAIVIELIVRYVPETDD